MKKCEGCLCQSCIESCKCLECDGNVCECDEYQTFRQMSVFEIITGAPRYSWGHYGIKKDRILELAEYVRSGKYNDIAVNAAKAANEEIADYILLSVRKNKSYEKVEFAENLGRIPCGRTDFYGYRRLFYSLFDKELRRIGK